MPTIDFKETITDAIDIAHENILGFSEVKTVSFPLFTDQRYADWAAERILKSQAYPLSMVKIPVNRVEYDDVNAGDNVVFSFNSYAISGVIYRVLSITEESMTSEKIILECLEDIEYTATQIDVDEEMGYAEYTAPEAEALTHVDVVEAPYIAAGDYTKVIPLAARLSGKELGYGFYLSVDGGSSYSKLESIPTFQPYGTLVGSYTADTYAVDDTVGFRIEFATDMPEAELDKMQTVVRARLFSTDNISLLGNEIISFQTITPVSGTIYDFTGICRGHYDTEKESHSNGEDFWYLGNNYFRVIEHSNITKGVTAKFKMVPYTYNVGGDISDSTVTTLALTGRGRTPYRPINLKANDDHSSPRYTGDIDLSWNIRKRGEGLGTFSFNAVITDEAESYDGYYQIDTVVSGSTVRTTTAIADHEWTYTTAMNNSDNGSLAGEITFNLYNYKVANSVKYLSSVRTITVRKVT